MRKIVLYIAMSLDGYIADINGKVDWLTGENINNNCMDSYLNFIKTIDTVIIGKNTYNQIVNELSPNNWVYSGMKSYVITNNLFDNTDEIISVNEDVCSLVAKLKKEEGKNIWICGGSNIVNQLIEKNLIDIYHISVIPTILGNGIKLFNKFDVERKLKLINNSSYNGIVDLVYENRL
nr:dihydrofolate reductase family protein [uncultured Tyzzerella sp.]